MLALQILFVFFFVQNFEETTTQLLQPPKIQFPVTIVVNPCQRNPCKNGRCLVMSFGYYCECQENYIGKNCDKHPNTYCTKNPCQNNAVCTSTAGSEPYSCECIPPYTGQYCDQLRKIVDVQNISVEESNSKFLLNQTLSMIKTENITVENIEIVSNLLYNISYMNETESNTKSKLFFEIFDEVLDSANEKRSETLLNTTKKLSKTFEKYVNNLNLSEQSVFSKTTDNIAVLSFTLNSTNITQNGFTQLKANSSDIELASADSDVNFEDVKSSAFLDENVLSDLFEADSRPQVTFAVFEKSTIFDVNSSMLQYSEHNCSTSYDNQIISSVISVTTSKKIVSDSNFVKTLFRTTPSVGKCESITKKRYSCVFWDYTSSSWNSSGCSYSITKEGLHACQCNHLTNFAVLMTIDSSVSECQTCDFILKYASYIGSIASIISLSFLILFYSKDLIKKKMKKPKSQSLGLKTMFDYYIELLISLSFSLLFMNMFYLVFSQVKWNKHGHELCVSIAGFLHYFLLSSFCWMLSFALLQYLTFNKVFVVIKNYYVYAALFSLVTPLVPIAAIMAMDWRLYENQTFHHCWLGGYSALFGVIVPILIIITINFVVFMLIFKKHCTFCAKLSEKTKVVNSKKQTIITATSFVNLGLTWSMAFLLLIPMDNYSKTAIALLFCVFNSLQGFFLFLVYIILTKSKRQIIKSSIQDKFHKIKDIFSYAEQNRHVAETSVSSKNTSIGYNQSSIYNSSTSDILYVSYEDKL